MTHEQMIRAALEEGFSSAAVTATEEMVFDPSFRPYCEENLCGQYGVNYTCPPDCGTPEEMRLRLLAHRHAVVLQSKWDIPDYTDEAAIRRAKTAHNAASIRLAKRLRAEGHVGIIVGSSGCALCSPCAITRGEPCLHPEFCFSCMSAYCIYVKKLAETCDMEYTCSDGKLAFFGLYVFD